MFVMSTAKNWLELPESMGTNPEKMPPDDGLHGEPKSAWMTEWFCG
jgi:hypothetical protein